METEGEHMYAVCSVLSDVGRTEIHCDGKCELGLLGDISCVILTIAII